MAAFRRYADKNGLFIPIAAPIPSGRRGRFAVTLNNGGVMIEGEADIVSSATTPSVLHGRVGMTLRFVEPDIKSKTVLVELEQARLTMRPQPPSVPPRPAQIPAEPRPKVPTIAGRIDANNQLAECVAIGDIEALEATVPQVPKSGGPRFVVPTIPPVAGGGRPKAPSTPPMGYPAAAKPATMPPPVRPLTPSSPPPLAGPPAIPPKPPSIAPIASARPAGTQPPATKPLGAMPPLAKPSGAMPPLAKPSSEGPALPRTATMLGTGGTAAKATDEIALPRTSTLVGTSAPPSPPTSTPSAAQSGPTLVAAPIVSTTPSDVMPAVAKPGLVTPTSITTVDAPLDVPPEKPSPTQGWDAASPENDTGDDSDDGDFLGEEAPRDTLAMPALDPAEAVAALARARNPSDELTAVPPSRAAGLFQAMPPGSDSDTFASVSVASEKDAVPEPVPEDPPSISRPNGATGSGRVMLPPPRRTTGNTQPPAIANPMPVVSAKPTLSGVVPVRAPTQIGLPIVESKRPARTSGEVPLPPVVAEAREAKVPAPDVSDEPTDITGVPVVAESDEPAVVIASAPPVEDPPPPPSRTKSGPILPGAMRKTVIGVAVVPDGVTVLPASPSSPVEKPTEEQAAVEPAVEVAVEQAGVEPYLEAAIASAKKEVSADDAAAEEPTAKPAITQRPPVIEEPSGDWTMIPGAEGPTILPRKPEGKDGADGKRDTGDWTIENSPAGWTAPAKVDPRANIRPNTGPPVAMVAGEKPLEVTMTAKAFDIEEETKSGLKVEVDSSLGVEPPIAAGIDLAFQSTQFAAAQPVIMTPPPGTLSPIGASQMPPMVRMPSAGSGSFPEYPQASRSSAPADLFGKHASVGDSTSMIDTGKKTRFVIIAVSAGLAIVVGVVLLIVFGLGGEPKKTGSAAPAIAPVPADAAEVVAPPVVVDAAASVEPAVDAAQQATVAPSGECFVEVTSTPSGAEIATEKDVLGVTPARIVLPCGSEAKLTVRKAKFASSTRSVTPTQEGAKLKVTLGKTLYAVKVTSSPPGASITIAGKSAGVTPAMIKLPAGEQTVISIAKPGFNPDNPKITPKQNNQSIHVNLKKKGR